MRQIMIAGPLVISRATLWDATRCLRAAASGHGVLLVLLALGIGCRLRQYLACPSYWYDEAYLLLNVMQKSFAELLGPLELNQVAPPLFLWTLRALYEVAGPSEWAMRLPAAVASLLAMLVMVPLARRIVGERGWMWAVGLCAVSNHGLSHAYQVKPYSGDAMFTAAALLAAVGCLEPSVAPRGRSWALAGLFSAAVLLPWLSFPIAFVLGGVSLALFVDAVNARDLRRCVIALAFSLLHVGSFGLLWLVAARFHNSDYLRIAFGAHFMDTSSPLAAAGWIGRTLVHIAHYGNSGLGIPLAALAVLGVAACRARRRAIAVLLVSPLALAAIASALEQYPLGDRLCFFAVPCLWLLAASGMAWLERQLTARKLAWVGTLAVAAVLVPGALGAAKLCVLQDRYLEFREAYSDLRARSDPGDAVWMAFPEVYRVYFGEERPLLCVYTPWEVVEHAARSGPLWVVTPPESITRSVYPRLIQILNDTGAVAVYRNLRFHGIEMVRYEPAATGRTASDDVSIENQSGVKPPHSARLTRRGATPGDSRGPERTAATNRDR
jgi:hypothetical protein